jgi:hypothetical protein
VSVAGAAGGASATLCEGLPPWSAAAAASNGTTERTTSQATPNAVAVTLNSLSPQQAVLLFSKVGGVQPAGEAPISRGTFVRVSLPPSAAGMSASQVLTLLRSADAAALALGQENGGVAVLLPATANVTTYVMALQPFLGGAQLLTPERPNVTAYQLYVPTESMPGFGNLAAALYLQGVMVWSSLAAPPAPPPSPPPPVSQAPSPTALTITTTTVTVIATTIGSVATVTGLVIAVRNFKMNKTDFDEKQRDYLAAHSKKYDDKDDGPRILKKAGALVGARAGVHHLML